MSKLKLILLVIVIIIIAGGAIGYVSFDLDNFLYKILAKEFKKDVRDSLQRDGMEILMAGTGSPRYSENRGQSCVGVIAAGQFLVFDTGSGSNERLIKMGAPTGQISSIFLTHLHGDHVAGLGEVLKNSWLYGRRTVVTIYGPPGTEKVIDGFWGVYELDVYDQSKTRAENLDPSISLGVPRIVALDNDDAHVVHEKNGLVVKAFRVVHPQWKYAYGYRIEYGGKALVISGDTRFSRKVIKHAENADMLIHEAYSKRMMDAAAKVVDDLKLNVDSKALRAINSVHTNTLEAAEVAKSAGVKTLVLTHIIPPLRNKIAEKIFVYGMDDIYDGEIVLSEDGMRLTIPAKN